MKDVCIIVPYRDRQEHLSKFVPHINEALASEDLTFQILVVEQTPEKPFNRGKLLNIGFDHTRGNFKNYVFHDIDMLPIKDKASYVTVDIPTHYAAIVEQFGWNLAYSNYVGGVIAFDEASFSKINGFCNEYWGWGAEDDDLFRRCNDHGITVNRRQNMYSSLHHSRKIQHDLYEKNLKLLNSYSEWKTDGLSTLKYEIKTQVEDSSYIKMTVEI